MLFGPKDLFEKKETEMLNEAQIMSYKGKGGNFSVDVISEPGRNQGDKDAYFKVTPDSDSYGGGEHETRVSFRQPTYVKHSKGKPHKNLSDKQIDNMIKLFNKPCKNIHGAGLTNWEYAIHRFNMSNNMAHLEKLDQTSAEVKNAIKSGHYIPLDLPMPDYTKL